MCIICIIITYSDDCCYDIHYSESHSCIANLSIIHACRGIDLPGVERELNQI